MKDHRRNVRFQSEQVLDCYHGNGHFEAEILDVSAGGIRIGCLPDLPLGTSILIQHRELSRSQIPVKAVVRWKKPGVIVEVGLEFLHEAKLTNSQWVGELFSDKSEFHNSHAQKRDEVRVDVTLPIVSEDGALEGETFDISVSGARFGLDQKLEDRTNLLICLPWSLLQVQAEVLRAEEEQGRWIHSVRFQDNDTETKEMLTSYVAGVVG